MFGLFHAFVSMSDLFDRTKLIYDKGDVDAHIVKTFHSFPLSEGGKENFYVLSKNRNFPFRMKDTKEKNNHLDT